jgi:xenotropic and polytropic retrovirus receptor 1
VFLAVTGLAAGLQQDLHDPVLGTKASYLLQIYGGYFFVLLLMTIFCLDARVFTLYKVHYQFVFEFDPRHHLDWRQLSELTALFGFLLGFFMYLNFRFVGGESFYVWWPVVLVCVSTTILVMPLPILYHRSRSWLFTSLGRMFFPGILPVEFRDFFLGDMFCSLTYAMGNIALFFCLYRRKWDEPQQCNSSHSVLMGFFTTLPGIWRALQCLRRYYDTRNVFPHLVNCGKYTCTILMYMMLSLWRIHRTWPLFGGFIGIATINSVYCITWDIFEDWSKSATRVYWRHYICLEFEQVLIS